METQSLETQLYNGSSSKEATIVSKESSTLIDHIYVSEP